MILIFWCDFLPACCAMGLMWLPNWGGLNPLLVSWHFPGLASKSHEIPIWAHWQVEGYRAHTFGCCPDLRRWAVLSGLHGALVCRMSTIFQWNSMWTARNRWNNIEDVSRNPQKCGSFVAKTWSAIRHVKGTSPKYHLTEAAKRYCAHTKRARKHMDITCHQPGQNRPTRGVPIEYSMLANKHADATKNVGDIASHSQP